MSEWKEYKYTELATIIGGGTPKTTVKEYWNGCIPWLSVKDFGNDNKYVYTTEKSITELGLNNSSTKMLKHEDIIISARGTVGELAMIPYPMSFNQSCFGIRAKEQVDPHFLYYLTKTKIRELKNSSHGSVFDTITRATFENISCNVPPITEQKRIASILSSLDDKISVNKKICENLEAQAQALFKHWFIDFAPFKNGKFVESELGMIPEGWRVGTLGEYVDNLNGYSYKGNELQPSTTAMVTIKNFVRGGGFKIEGFKEIVVSKKIKEYQYISLFDVLVAHTDLTQKAEVVGNPAIILSTGDYDKLVMSMDLTKVVPKDARITTPLLHSILSTRKFKEHALGYVNGTTVLHMNKKAVPEYCFAIPKNLDILKGLTAILDNIYRMMSEIYAENLRLSTLRDTLLPRLMSGQIKL